MEGKKKTLKPAIGDDEVEIQQNQPKKSFLQKEFKKLTAGEIIQVVAITAITIVAIIAVRDIVREIMETIQAICFFSLLAIVLVVAIVAGSRK